MTTTAPRLTNGLLFLSIGVIHNLCGIAVGLGTPGITPAALGGRQAPRERASAVARWEEARG